MKSKYIGKELWVELFRKTGLTEEKMKLWHHEFETASPEAHQEFLEWINIPENEINNIRML